MRIRSMHLVSPLVLLQTLVIAGAVGCGGGGSNSVTTNSPPPNPSPTISTISPSSTTAGGSAFALTVNGSGFIASSAVAFNGSARTTTYVSATQLTAAITAADIATAGSYSVTVANPTPGGGTSSAATFSVVAPNPLPAITSLSPSNATAGSAAFTLTVNGTGFIASSMIDWNGSPRATTFVSSTQLAGSIGAADVASAGTASVTVVNPAPGGGTSASSSFAIQPPAPTVSLSASANTVFVGQPLVLTWSTTNATTCMASGAWSGPEAASGTATVTPASSGSLTYTLGCTGPGGSGSQSAKVQVNTPAISISNAFTPNALTISTSEGAPYGDCDFWVQTAAQCTTESNVGYGPTTVMRLYICLTGEVTSSNCSTQPPASGPLSATMLADIDSRLAAFQGTGMRVMPRFIYNYGPIGSTAQDAPLSVILNHVDQLAPIVLKYKDIVFALEAGFIGTWGEWHDSTNGNDTATAQAQLLNKELGYFGGLFPVLVRYPGDIIEYANGLTPPAGIGMHDDYYASSSDDGGTWNTCDPGGGWCLDNYTPGQFQSLAAEISTQTMFVGEFGALYSTLQTCDALDTYSYTYNVQSISLYPYPGTIQTELQNESCALSFYNKVGTRIEIQNATVIGDPSANGQLYVAMTLANTGYGRVIRKRAATIALGSGGTILAQFPLSVATLDLTSLASAANPATSTFETTLTLPAGFPVGQSISLYLLVPDPAPSLTSQPAYALPLNSLDVNSQPVFDAATGYNLLATFQSQ